MRTLVDLIELLREADDLFGPEGPCPALVEPGSNGRILVLTGGNASGKSLACRFLEANAKDDAGKAVEFMRVGMAKRTEGGVIRAMMFGDEERDSTGGVSAGVVATGMDTCRGRKAAHFLCLDEPDIGLSERMQGGLGAALASFAASMPDLTLGLVVVTHSRHVAGALLALDPWCIRVGDDVRPTREWAATPEAPATEAEFLGLRGAAHARYRGVQRALNARKAKAGPAEG